MFWYKIPLVLTPIEPSLVPGAGVGFVIIATLATVPSVTLLKSKYNFQFQCVKWYLFCPPNGLQIMMNTWPGIGYKILIPSINPPPWWRPVHCPGGRGSWRCWDHQPMWLVDNADMVRGRINSSKICDPKTDVKEFYSILGIWWESYQIYYIDGLQNSWGMFSITSNIQHRLQPVPTQDPRRND